VPVAVDDALVPLGVNSVYAVVCTVLSGNVNAPLVLRLTVHVPLINVDVVADTAPLENTVPFINIDPAVDNANVHVPLTMFVAVTALPTYCDDVVAAR
jgi:hypothetical protein